MPDQTKHVLPTVVRVRIELNLTLTRAVHSCSHEGSLKRKRACDLTGHEPSKPCLEGSCPPGSKSGGRHTSNFTHVETDTTESFLIADQKILDQIFLLHVESGGIRGNLVEHGTDQWKILLVGSK